MATMSTGLAEDERIVDGICQLIRGETIDDTTDAPPEPAWSNAALLPASCTTLSAIRHTEQRGSGRLQ